eukprot:SAG31_NODE_140_length_22731_cov_10.941410_2_plen_108_part_00
MGGKYDNGGAAAWGGHPYACTRALVAESARHSRQQSQRHTRRCAAVALGEIIAAEQRAVHRGGATVRRADPAYRLCRGLQNLLVPRYRPAVHCTDFENTSHESTAVI